MRSAGRPLELDARFLAARAVFRSPVPWWKTPYTEIRAEVVRGRGDELAPLDTPAPRTPAEARSELRRALETTVEHALGDARSAAVLAGGGLDSSALLALALRWARRRGATVFAVALDFGGDGDDRPHLLAVERHLGCEVLRVKPEDAARRFGLFRRGVDGAPFTWPAGPMEVEALARARDHGAEVVLSGVGADELFDGYPSALAELPLRHPLTAARRARTMRGFWPARSPVYSWVVRPRLSRLAAEYLPAGVRRRRWGRHAERAHPAWAGPVLLELLREIARLEADALLSRVSPMPSGGAEGPPSPWDAPHLEHVAWLRHQEQIAAGIELRQPFLEPSLRAWVGALAPVWLLDGDVRRGLFREAVRDLLPQSVVERTDKALFELGHRRFLAASAGRASRGGAGVDAVRDLASVDELAALGIVLPGPFASAFATFAAAGDRGMSFTNVWPVLAVESFVRSFRGNGRGNGTTESP